MTESNELCASCGAPLAPTALAGFCLRCLATAAFGVSNPPALASEAAPPRTRFLGGYELLDEIGRGGMGVVYRARQAGLGREVALKVLAAGPYANEIEVASFRAEAKAAAALRHPGIVAVYEVGEADGHAYFSMELVDGISLAMMAADGPLDPRRAARYVRDVAHAVAAAHARGILHRDLKPGNVLVDRADQARVTDFGLSRQVGSESTQHIAGSPGYMPPEQADPKRGGMGVAADVYGLGALLYHLLTGRPPFSDSTTIATLALVLTKEPTPPRQLNPSAPADLETICLKCLAKEPSRRYASAREVADELEACLERRPIRARPVGALERLWMWARRHPGLAAMGAVWATVAGVTIAAFLWQSSENHLNLYAADLRVAAEDIQHGDLSRARSLLARHAPLFGEAPFVWRYLEAQSAGDPRTLLGRHPWIVSAVAWSPDGRWIASGSLGSGTVGADLRLWPASGAPVILATNTVRQIQWFPDGRRLLAVGNSGAAIWDIIDKKALTNFPASGAQISRDGKWLATCQGDALAWDTDGPAGPVCLRDLETGNARRFPDGRIVAISPSGKKLALSDAENQIDIFATDTGAQEHHLTGVGKVWAMVFSQDDQTLALTGFESDVRVLRLGGSKPSLERWAGHSLATWRAAFSPDGLRLLTTSSDQTLRLWDAKTGAPLDVFRGHGGEVWCASFSSDGSRFVSGGKDRNIFVWPAVKPSPEGVMQSRLWTRRFFSADGRKFVTVSTNDPANTLVYDVNDKAPPQALEIGRPLAMDADGNLLSLQGPFEVEWRSTLHPDAGHQISLDHGAKEQEPHIWDASADGRILAGLTHERLLSAWDGRTGRRIASLTTPVGDAWLLTLSSDGQWVALTLGENGFLLCSMHEGTIRPLTAHLDEGKWAAFSPDSRLLATASSDATIKLWDVASGRELATLRGHLTEASAVAIAPDNRTLVSVEREQGLRFWDLPTRREVAVVPVANAGAWVSFAPDGHALSVGDGEEGVRLLKAP